MKLERILSYRVNQIDLICNSTYTTGIVFFATKLILALVVIAAIIMLLVRYDASTSIIMNIFTRFDQATSLGNIQKCENFIEIMDYLDKHNINKIELSHQLQDNLFVAKEKAQLKNKNTIRIKELDFEKNSIRTESEKGRKRFVIHRGCGFSKQILIKAALLFVVPIMILSNIALFLVYSNPIRKVLTNVEELRFNTGSNIIYFVLQREALLGRFNSSQVAMIRDWEINVLGKAKSIAQIFNSDGNYAFKNSISDLVISSNTDICKFWHDYGKELPECALPKFKKILSKGISTVFVYINNQLKIINDAQNARGEYRLNPEQTSQLEFVEDLNLLMLKVLNYCTDQYATQMKSSSDNIIFSYLILLGCVGALTVVFVTVLMIIFSRYFYLKKLFFEKVFILVSPKTISENTGLYNFLKRKVQKEDEE